MDKRDVPDRRSLVGRLVARTANQLPISTHDLDLALMAEYGGLSGDAVNLDIDIATCHQLPLPVVKKRRSDVHSVVQPNLD